MLLNFFKTAFRNFLKNKAFSFINIIGLSVGISVCFIIMLFVRNELSYDRFNEKADRIYRIQFKATINGGKISEANVMPPVAQALVNEYPEVEEATRLRFDGKPSVGYQGKTFKDGQLVLVDSNFFNVFSVKFIEGDKRTALREPYSIVLTKQYAEKYFGHENALGKLLSIDNDPNPCKVTGVIEQMPPNSHFHFDQFVSMSTTPEARELSWLSSNFFTYLVLKKGYDYKKLEAKFPGMVEKYMGPQIQKSMGLSLAQFRTKGNDLGFILQPLTDIHFHSKSNFEFEPGGEISYVYIFGAIALFMLVIACINFINLSTAGATRRAKEVGIRKVMGSSRTGLIRQFLVESVFISFLAMLISLVLIKAGLPLFNELSGKNLSPWLSLPDWLAFLALGIAVGLLAGIYPAFFLSSFKPIATLKGKITGAGKHFSLRSGLVVFQFFISVCLIIGTMVVYLQMKFIQTIDLGYNKDQLLVLSNSSALGKNEPSFRDELLKDSRILNATISGYKPAGPSYNNNALAYPAGDENQVITALEYKIDDRYIPTFGMQIKEGRNFSSSLASDSTAMIINESAARVFGWTGNAVGRQIIRENSDRGKNVAYHVVGVVKDFHFKSLHETISPLFMVMNPESGIVAKVRTADVVSLIASIKNQWNSFNPQEPMAYSYMDDLYRKTYSSEQKTGLILNIFTALTLLVARLGLFGLATYTAGQRAREISIRKVLGATVSQVTNMLSKEFIKLVLIGCVVAFPLAWWAGNKWLESFAYRIHLSWWIFLFATVLALLIALLTVGLKSIKAALANPVAVLRSE